MLDALLPDVLDGAELVAVNPASPFTRAWGDPAVTLRCGVPQPAAYGPTSLLTVVDGVDWLPVEGPASTTFYATGRVAWVEVVVPLDLGSPAGVLVDLGATVSDAVPTTG